MDREAHNKRIRRLRAIRTEAQVKRDSELKRQSRLRNSFSAVYLNAQKKAKIKGIKFDLNRDWMRARYHNTKVSELSGIEFNDRVSSGKGKARPFARSIDRINSDVGYIQGNIRIICVCENIALGEWGIGVYDKMCKARVRRLLR